MGSVAKKLAALPRGDITSRSFISRLSPAQRKTFNEWLEEIRKTPQYDWPTYDIMAKAISEDVGVAIHKDTLRNYLKSRTSHGKT